MSRPKGSKNKWKPDVLVKSKEKLQRKAVQMALNGNETCMRICMDRLYPRLRNIAAPVKIKTGSTDPAVQAVAIVSEALSGKLSPDVLREFLGALADLVRIKEFSEVEARLLALESRKDKAPWEENAGHTSLPFRSRKRRTSNAAED